VSLVDEDRVWFKSRVGIDIDQTARDAGLFLRQCSRKGFIT